jgi:hypothetical protein
MDLFELNTTKSQPSASRILSDIEMGVWILEQIHWKYMASRLVPYLFMFSAPSSRRDRSGDNLQSAEIQVDVYGS